MSADTIALDAFLPLVMPHCPAVPEFVALRNLRLAAIEFCERTRCWRHLTSVQIAADGQAIAAPSFAAIHLIERATFEGGRDLTPIQFSDVDERAVQETIEGQPAYITQSRYDTVRIIPFMAGQLDLALFLKPVNGETFSAAASGLIRDSYDRIPEFMWNMHAEPIASGAIARILTQPEKPWTNPQLAVPHAARFDAAMNTHFSASIRGQHRARHRTRYVDF
jgi:hypothetical protein